MLKYTCLYHWTISVDIPCLLSTDQLSCDGVSDVCYPDDSVVGVVFNWSHRAVVAVRVSGCGTASKVLPLCVYCRSTV